MSKRKYPLTANEAVEQAALFHWAALQQNAYPELEWMYHIPNGGSRHRLEAYNLKKQGVKSGVPDICLPVARGEYHGLYIELKAHNNTPTENQKKWLAGLKKNGYYSVICWGWEQAAEAIKQYLSIGMEEAR